MRAWRDLTEADMSLDLSLFTMAIRTGWWKHGVRQLLIYLQELDGNARNYILTKDGKGHDPPII
jgi:hypothetical protein